MASGSKDGVEVPLAHGANGGALQRRGALCGLRVGAGLWVAVQALGVHNSRKEAKAEDKNVKIAVKALLRGQVMDLGLHYISKGYIPPYGLETLRNYYDPYVALGDGDPSIKHIVETCESLPVHSGETEVNT